MLKTYIKSYGILYGIILLLTILLSIFNYYTLNTSIIFNLLIPIISILISTIFLGKNSNNKAYLEGIKFTSIYIIISIITSIILKLFSIKNLIFNIILLFIGTIGSMIGINFKKNKV